MSVPPAPEHLSDEAKQWWADLGAVLELDDPAARLLLRTTCETLDRLRDFQRVLAEEGVVVRDRFDQAKPHPAVTGERDARSALLMALRALDKHRTSGLEAWHFDEADLARPSGAEETDVGG